MIEQQDRELDSWTKIIEKALDVKAQASLQPTSYIKEMDQWYLRDNQLNSTKASTKGNLIRDSRMEESWSKPQEPKASALQHQAEAFKKARKEKKKKDQQFGRDRQQEGSTSTTGVNAAKTVEQKKKNKNWSRSDRMTQDVSQVTY